MLVSIITVFLSRLHITGCFGLVCLQFFICSGLLLLAYLLIIIALNLLFTLCKLSITLCKPGGRS